MGLNYIFFGFLAAVAVVFAFSALGRLAQLIFIIAGEIAWKRRKPQLHVDDAANAFHQATKKRSSARHQRHD